MPPTELCVQVKKTLREYAPALNHYNKGVTQVRNSLTQDVSLLLGYENLFFSVTNNPK